MSTAASPRTDVQLSTSADLFFDQLCQAKSRVLLLDYDGTIAPFSAYRNRAFPYPTVPEFLDCIMSTCRTRVALISGRAAGEIPPLLGVNPHPEIWGTYGMERLHPDGRYEVAPISEDAERALFHANRLLRNEGLDRLTESKPGAIAVHWRGLTPAETEETRARAYRLLLPIALESNLLLAPFDGGLELRVPGRNKGDALRTVLSEISPEVPVAYLGDDKTDEDAFRALNGRGLTVLVRPTYRFTAAQKWIRPPEELITFLTDWVRACGGDM